MRDDILTVANRRRQGKYLVTYCLKMFVSGLCLDWIFIFYFVIITLAAGQRTNGKIELERTSRNSQNTSCAESQFGCCTDGLTIAEGSIKQGCPGIFTKCERQRNDAMNSNNEAGFIPKCLESGLFAATQCWSKAGICWCADLEGFEIGGSRTDYPEKPNCRRDDCRYSSYGCCGDEKTFARGPEFKGCPGLKLKCDLTEFGCCPDGVRPAKGPRRLGCPTVPSACNRRRAAALKRVGLVVGKSIPECRPDGTFARIQCHVSTGYCWCVNEFGDEVKGTRIRGKPDCDAGKCQDRRQDCEDFAKNTDYCVSYQEYMGKYCAKSCNFCTAVPTTSKPYKPKRPGCKSEYGCCDDGLSPAIGPEDEGCPVYGSVCLMPAILGPCKAQERRYFFNKNLGHCEKFFYGGCKGNRNNFKTLSECERFCFRSLEKFSLRFNGSVRTVRTTKAPPTAEPRSTEASTKVSSQKTTVEQESTPTRRTKTQSTIPTSSVRKQSTKFVEETTVPTRISKGIKTVMKTSAAPKTTVATTATTRQTIRPTRFGCGSAFGCCKDGLIPALGPAYLGCPEYTSVCQMPAARGPCRRFSRRYFYNFQLKKCERFEYGGCDGNGNNFADLKTCLMTCIKDMPHDKMLELERTTVSPSTVGTKHFESLSECEKRRQLAIRKTQIAGHAISPEERVYLPECHEDGSFKRVQCWSERGLCWCVDTDGNQVGNTRTKGRPSVCPAEETLADKTCQDKLNQCTAQALIKNYCEDYSTFMRTFCPKSCGFCERILRPGCSSDYGCCQDGISPAKGTSYKGCPVYTSICEMPKNSGPCRAGMPRFFFNKSSGRCEKFIYGGCKGNMNNFQTRVECHFRCEDAIQTTIPYQVTTINSTTSTLVTETSTRKDTTSVKRIRTTTPTIKTTTTKTTISRTTTRTLDGTTSAGTTAETRTATTTAEYKATKELAKSSSTTEAPYSLLPPVVITDAINNIDEIKETDGIEGTTLSPPVVVTDENIDGEDKVSSSELDEFNTIPPVVVTESVDNLLNTKEPQRTTAPPPTTAPQTTRGAQTRSKITTEHFYSTKGVKSAINTVISLPTKTPPSSKGPVSTRPRNRTNLTPSSEETTEIPPLSEYLKNYTATPATFSESPTEVPPLPEYLRNITLGNETEILISSQPTTMSAQNFTQTLTEETFTPSHSKISTKTLATKPNPTQNLTYVSTLPSSNVISKHNTSAATKVPPLPKHPLKTETVHNYTSTQRSTPATTQTSTSSSTPSKEDSEIAAVTDTSQSLHTSNISQTMPSTKQIDGKTTTAKATEVPPLPDYLLNITTPRTEENGNDRTLTENPTPTTNITATEPRTRATQTTEVPPLPDYLRLNTSTTRAPTHTVKSAIKESTTKHQTVTTPAIKKSTSTTGTYSHTVASSGEDKSTADHLENSKTDLVTTTSTDYSSTVSSQAPASDTKDKDTEISRSISTVDPTPTVHSQSVTEGKIVPTTPGSDENEKSSEVYPGPAKGTPELPDIITKVIDVTPHLPTDKPPLTVGNRNETSRNARNGSQAKCLRHRQLILWKHLEGKKNDARPPPGAYLPTCQENGEYETMQCWGSVGECWCVDKTGKEIPRSRVRGTPDCSRANMSQCEIEHRKALQQNSALSSDSMENPDLSPVLFIPECDEDGSYSYLQCHKEKNQCWCSTKDGKEIVGTRIKNGKPNCSNDSASKCERHRKDAARLSQIVNGEPIPVLGTFVPKCEKDGRFTAMQCWEATSFCWCVDNDGNEIKGTRTMGRANCHINNTRLSLCERQLKRVKERENLVNGKRIPLLGAFTPRCEKNGDFSPIQCHGSIGYCWCVTQNGTEIKGTRMRGKPKCPQDDEYIPRCKPDGNFTTLQCWGEVTQCWCVDADGKEIIGTRNKGRVNCRKVLAELRFRVTPSESPNLHLRSTKSPAVDTESSDSSSLCELPVHPGGCDNPVIRWFFNKETNACQSFEFSGCGGNANNFKTIKECVQRCIFDPKRITQPQRNMPTTAPKTTVATASNPCLYIKNKGNCSESFLRWFYNVEMKACQPFLFTGCGGNANNFPTAMHCDKACNSKKRLITLTNLKENKPSTASVAVGTNKLAISRRACLLPPQTGPCRGYLERWHYDQASKRCLKFVYGGCRGNANNFRSNAACLESCYLRSGPFTVLPTTQAVLTKELQGTNNKCKGRYGCCKDNVTAADGPNFKGCPSYDSLCTMPPAAGPCNAKITRWFYNKEMKSCTQFVWGGCDGNQNNFGTVAECFKTCGNFFSGVTNNPGTLAPATKVFKGTGHNIKTPFNKETKTEKIIRGCNGTYGCCDDKLNAAQGPNKKGCPVYSSICDMPLVKGKCKSRIVRWYYDPNTLRCESFIFSGCGGNQNNFANVDVCSIKCEKGEPLCIDRIPENCPKWKEQGYCRSRRTLMTKYCRKSCDLCF